MRYTGNFGVVARTALKRHYPTLERLVFDDYSDLTSDELVQVLASSPNLRTLIDIVSGNPCRGKNARIDANRFIDQDPNTGILRPWACETTLKELTVRITGIPRPDSNRYEAWERYPGQGREIQDRVYDRISRLTNLEVLWLGFPSDIFPSDIFYRDCLEMSLESGLHKLSGLKKLKELNVSSLLVSIGVKDVQWMTEHWPELRTIYGVERRWRDKKVGKWMQRHHPEINWKRR